MDNSPIIQCHLNCLPAFREVESYFHPIIDKVFQEDAIYSPRILDIGANVGAFSVACNGRWPRTKINAFEPDIRVHEFLVNNCLHIPEWSYMGLAVTSQKSPKLFPGETPLCSSLIPWQRTTKDGYEILSLHPSELPASDFVKIDTEGNEFDIMRHLKFTPAYLALEYHSEQNRKDCYLSANLLNMELIERTGTDSLGVMKFVRVRK